MPITGGRVIYSRTVQVAQFEPRRVEIEIAFSCENESELAGLIDDAKTIAREEVLSLVNQRDR